VTDPPPAALHNRPGRSERDGGVGLDGYRAGSGRHAPVDDGRARYSANRWVVPRRMGESLRFLSTQS
jgi:hypothetical protein